MCTVPRDFSALLIFFPFSIFREFSRPDDDALRMKILIESLPLSFSLFLCFSLSLPLPLFRLSADPCIGSAYKNCLLFRQMNAYVQSQWKQYDAFIGCHCQFAAGNDDFICSSSYSHRVYFALYMKFEHLIFLYGWVLSCRSVCLI